jgi:hypothetical protein
MDRRLRRPVRRSDPDNRRGTATARRCPCSAMMRSAAPESRTISPAPRRASISGSADGRSTTGERKGGVPSVHHAAERQPPPSTGPATSGGCAPLARQAVTSDRRSQVRMLFHGKAGRYFPEQKETILPEEFRV